MEDVEIGIETYDYSGRPDEERVEYVVSDEVSEKLPDLVSEEGKHRLVDFDSEVHLGKNRGGRVEREYHWEAVQTDSHRPEARKVRHQLGEG